VHLAEEEIYVTMVVVKRPARPHRQEADPSQWAQAVLDSLAVDAPPSATGLHRLAAHGVAPMGGTKGRPAGSRFAGTRNSTSTWTLLGLSLLCFLGSACSFYFLVK